MLAGLVGLALFACAPGSGPEVAATSYEEYDIAALQQAMDGGELTARGLVDYYLERIETIDRSGPELRAIIELNPEAQAIADALDVERRDSGPRGPLHGIPVLVPTGVEGVIVGRALYTGAVDLAEAVAAVS